MSEPILSLQEISKRFAVKVLDGVSFDLRGGEIHALLGSNGAGKSTLCRIIAGLTPPTSGTMFLENAPFAPASKRDAENRGVQIVQQELCLIPTLSVAENLFLSRMPHRLGVIDRRKLQHRARLALDRVGLQEINPETPVRRLGIGQQQLVEIAIALDRDCRVLILDEPTSALSIREADNLFRWLDQLRDQGIGIVYISHRLDEVKQIADRVTILRDGRHICTRQTPGFSSDEMVDLMTGETAVSEDGARFQTYRTDRVGLRVDGMTRGSVVRDVSFSVQRGERFGIAGLVGAGRTELLRLIFGADAADTGSIQIGDDDKPRRFHHPHQAVEAGLAMVTEDRKSNGLLLPLSICTNLSIAALSLHFSRKGLIRSTNERTIAAETNRQLDVRCQNIDQSVQTLSGGNQQKIAIGKWLLRRPNILLFDEPTRGIDVAARRKVYQLIESLAAEQKTIIMVSSDLEELLDNCDRIAVMSAGKLAAIFNRGHWSADQIMRAAFSEHVGKRA